MRAPFAVVVVATRKLYAAPEALATHTHTHTHTHTLHTHPRKLTLAQTSTRRRYVSTTTKRPYLLGINVIGGKIQIKSVGTSAWIIRPNIRCGAGIVHVINNVRRRGPALGGGARAATKGADNEPAGAGQYGRAGTSTWVSANIRCGA